MGILGRTFVACLAALTGCYAPAVRDCTVRCDSPSHCASDQICGNDHLCVSRAFTGQCMSSDLDASSQDGSALVPLHVQIIGKGAVTVAGRDTCSSLNPQHGDCTYDIALGIAQDVFAIEIQSTQKFTQWSSVTCAGQGASCTFVPVAPTTIVAEFASARSHHEF